MKKSLNFAGDAAMIALIYLTCAVIVAMGSLLLVGSAKMIWGACS